MAYVIGSPCINVKDTACVDVCPVDCIHAYADSEMLYIDPATCIDCSACETACPVNAIWPADSLPDAEKKYEAVNAAFFESFDKSKSVVYLKQQEAGAGAEEGETKAEGDVSASLTEANWQEQEGWEAKWEAHKSDKIEKVEERKRYGRVRSVWETDDKYILRFHLPEKLPVHPYVYQYGLPAEMCSYKVKAELRGKVAHIRGKMTNPNISKLSGLANSFPDRFYVQYAFGQAVSSVSVTPRGEHIVDVVATKS